MAFVCSERSERQSIGLPVSSALSFHYFPSLPISVIDLFFTSLAVACRIFNTGPSVNLPHTFSIVSAPGIKVGIIKHSGLYSR